MIRLRSSRRRNPFIRAARAGVGLVLVAGLVSLPGGPALAATFMVGSNGDASDASPGDGACATAGSVCTLRAAIEETNALSGPDVILFGSSVTTIRPGSALPAITDALAIDGSVASPIPPNFPVPGVEVDGSLAGAADGLRVEAAMSSVRGLAVNGFAGDGIVVGADDVQIAGTFIGTDLSGMVSAGNAGAGIHAIGASGLSIGGSSFLDDRTVVSANGRGIVIEGGGSSTITSALVGTDAATEGDLGNAGDGLTVLDHGTTTINANQISGNDGTGVVIVNTDGVTMNGNAVGVDLGGSLALPNAAGIDIRGGDGVSEGLSLASNQISANLGAGVRIGDENPVPGAGVAGLSLVNNAIGTDPGGGTNLGNGGDGIHFLGGDNDGAMIGGTGVSLGNLIAFNGGAGVRVGAGNTNERIQANSIYDNAGLGILLDPTANNDQQPPELTALTPDPTTPDTWVDGTLTGFAPDHEYRIEFFGNPDCAAGAGEGRAFLRQRSFTTDAQGAASFSTPIPLDTWGAVTATATDDGGTSQFSNCLELGGGGPASADLSITKSITSQPPFVGGGELTYELGVGNDGPDAAAEVTVTDALPAGTALVLATASQGACQTDAGVVSCGLGDLAPGAGATVSLTVTLPDVEDLTTVQNVASVSSTTADPDDSNNAGSVDADVIGRRVDLALLKSAPTEVIEGDAFDYTLTVSNRGPDPAHDVTLTDPLPGEVVFGSASAGRGSCSHVAGTVTCALGSIGASDSVVVTISVRAGTYAGGDPRSFDNAASVASDRVDSAPGDERSTAPVTEHPAGADLSISKTDGVESASGGEDLTYTLAVHNDGPGDATDVTLTDPLPDDTAFASANASQGSCSEAGGVLTCQLGDVSAGGSVAVTLVVRTDAVDVDTELENTASVDAAEPDPDPTNDSASDRTTLVPAGGADLLIESFDDAPDPVTGGYLIGYTVVIRNEGVEDAHDSVLTQTLPPGTAFVAPTPNPFACQAVDGTARCAIGTIAAGGSVSALLILRTAEVSETTSIASVVEVASPDDADESNDTGDEQTSIVPRETAFASGFVPPNDERRFITDAVTRWRSGWPIATSTDPTTAGVLSPGGGPGGVLSIVETTCGGAFACPATHRFGTGGKPPAAVLGSVVTVSTPAGGTARAPFTGYLLLDRSIVPSARGVRVAFSDAQTGLFVASLPWCGRSGPAPACVADVDRVYSWIDRVRFDLRVKVRFLGAGSFALMR
ncbi:MAG: right-handed parallel beta-helix repeat-containing protein [Actinomycetota bacterium]